MNVVANDPDILNLRYRQLLERPARTSDACETRYARVRAAIILGEWQSAEQLIHGIRDELPSWLRKFLCAQLSVSRRQEVSQAIDLMHQLKECAAKSPYFSGELAFQIGFAHLTLDENNAGIPHLEDAVQFYLLADLPAHQSIALFNLALGHAHLGNSHESTEAAHRLTELARVTGNPIVVLHHHRMAAYRAADREDFEEAIAHARKALAVAQEAERNIDWGAMATLLGYLFAKCRRVDALERLTRDATDLMRHDGVLQSRFVNPLNLFLLLGAPFVEETAATRCLAAILTSNFDTANKLFALELLAERCEQSLHHEILRTVVAEADRIATEQQQSKLLVDFESYRIHVLLLQGMLQEAASRIRIYSSQAILTTSQRRIQKAKHLAFLHSSLQSTAPTCQAQDICLDTRAHKLILAGNTYSLTRQPMVERALVALVSARSPLSLSQFFEAVYDTKYDPVRHLARLKALIDRTKRLTGETKLLLRRDGNVELNPYFKFRIGSAADTNDVGERRNRIVAFAATEPHGISISELQERFNAARRTLQLDLEILRKQQRLRARGHSRKRRYFANSEMQVQP